MEDQKNSTKETIKAIRTYKKLLKEYKKTIVNPKKLDQKIKEAMKQ